MRLFDNLEPSSQSALLAKVRLEDEELPVIGSVHGMQNWLLLTTLRLLWSNDGKCDEILLSTIAGVAADLAKLKANGVRKGAMSELCVRTTGGKEAIISLEPGAPLVGIWSILNLVGSRNRSMH